MVVVSRVASKILLIAVVIAVVVAISLLESEKSNH